MVLHGAVTYFNEQSGEMEYLVAGECSAQVTHSRTASPNTDCIVDSSFSGQDFAGFIGGELQVSYHTLPADMVPEAFFQQARELDEVFTGIAPNKYYGNVPMLKNADRYWLLVAQRTPGLLSLYTVAKQTRLDRIAAKTKVPPHRARLLHFIHRGQLDEVAASTCIFSPGAEEYVGLDSAAVYDLKTAQEFSKDLFSGLLASYTRGRDAGPMVFYTVGFDGVRRL